MSDDNQSTRGKYSRTDLIEHIQRLADGDDPPTTREFNADDDTPSAETVKNYFGTWNTAVEAAGCDPHEKNPNQQYSRDELISHIQRLADGDGPPTTREFNADDDTPSAPTVRHHFDSWNTAVEAAGCHPHEKGPNPQYSRDELISHIQRLADGDDPPTRQEYADDDDAPSPSTVLIHFGTWNTAVEAAGYDPNGKGPNQQYSRDELISHIQRLADGDDPPTQREYAADDDAPSLSTVLRHFDSWNTAVEAAGYDPHENGRSQQYARDELISHIQRLADGDTPPTQQEYADDDDAPSPSTVLRRLGSWENAVEAAGFEPRLWRNDGSPHQYSEDEIIDHIQRLADGDNPPTQSEFRADDDAPSVGTARNRFGDWNSAIQTAGFQPRSSQSQ